HRAVDPTGLSTWTAFLAAGGTREQLEAAVAGSPEDYQKSGGTAGGFLDALYRDALGGTRDPTGRATWDLAQMQGATPGQVATAVFGSTEFLQDRVQGWYQSYLHRLGESAGLDFWTAALRQGTQDDQVIAGIVGSDEYLGRL